MSATAAVAYLRVSSKHQAEKGLSLAAQRAKVEAYAKLFNLRLVDVVVDKLTAKTLHRPALERALAQLKAGRAQALLVVKLDRLTRSVRDLGQLIEEYFAPNKYILLSVSEQIDTRSAAGRLVLNVLTSVAQWEREAIGERTAAVMQHKKSLNEYTGGEPPIGFRLARDGRHLRPHSGEKRVLRAAIRLRKAGLSLRQIAARLDRGHTRTRQGRSRSGRPYDAGQIARMLRRAGLTAARGASTRRRVATAA